MAGITNKGKYLLLDGYFRNTGGSPASFTVRLLAACSTAPGASINNMSDLVEVSASNGYNASGCAIARNSTDWDTLTEDDSASRALVRIKDVAWVATGGDLPATTSCPARWAVLTDAVAGASSNVIAFWDLSSNRRVSDTQTLTLQDLELRLNEA